MGVGSGFPGRNSMAMTLVPLGMSLTSILFCTPKANFIEPAICLNFNTSISENANSNTKKHINNDIKSAKVPIHAGKPSGGHLGHSSSAITLPRQHRVYWLLDNSSIYLRLPEGFAHRQYLRYRLTLNFD